MGSPPHSTLYFGDHAIYGPDYSSDEFANSMFVRADKVVRTLSWAEMHPDFPADSPHLSSYDTEERFTTYHYIVPIHHAIERLELRDYTLEAASKAFKSGMYSLVYYLSDAGRWMKFQTQRDDWSAEIKVEFAAAYRHAFDQQQFYLDFTFEQWLDRAKTLFEREIRPYDLPTDITPQSEPHLYFMLQEHAARTSIWGFPCDDLNFVFRALLEVCPHPHIKLDYTRLIDAELGDSEGHILTDRPHFVLLTEGASDVEILKATLSHRFPHLCSYYSFMEFDVGGAGRVSGSANELVKLVKAFVGAGISDRIIAVFDNDAAATEVLRALKGVALPHNIRVLQLPDLDFARHYPTLGPQNLDEPTPVNVNGAAGSIELYLGRDVLAGEDGELTPVRWSSFLAGAKRYQGELDDKAALQRRYLQLLQADAQDSGLKAHDWEAMDSLWHEIFRAFSDSTPEFKHGKRRVAPVAFYFGPKS